MVRFKAWDLFKQPSEGVRHVLKDEVDLMHAAAHFRVEPIQTHDVRGAQSYLRIELGLDRVKIRVSGCVCTRISLFQTPTITMSHHSYPNPTPYPNLPLTRILNLTLTLNYRYPYTYPNPNPNP